MGCTKLDCIYLISWVMIVVCLLSACFLFDVVFQAPSYHLLFEAILIVAIVRLFFMKSYKPERTVLTEKVLFCLDCSVLL